MAVEISTACGSGGADGLIKVWDLETGQRRQTLAGHQNSVRALSLHPNGRHLASASWDKTVKLWDLTTGQALRTLEGHTDRVVTVAFDGRTIVSGGNFCPGFRRHEEILFSTTESRHRLT